MCFAKHIAALEAGMMALHAWRANGVTLLALAACVGLRILAR